MQMDYSKLKGRMAEKGVSQKELAGVIGVSVATLSSKFNNKTYFSIKEAKLIGDYLGIADYNPYFFTLKL